MVDGQQVCGWEGGLVDGGGGWGGEREREREREREACVRKRVSLTESPLTLTDCRELLTKRTRS